MYCLNLPHEKGIPVGQRWLRFKMTEGDSLEPIRIVFQSLTETPFTHVSSRNDSTTGIVEKESAHKKLLLKMPNFIV